MLWTLIVCSLLFDAVCLALAPASRPQVQPSLSASPRPNPVEDNSLLSVDSAEHDFGTIFQKTTVEHRFKLTNKGTEPVEIVSVDASCGCTSTLLSEKVLQPGQSGELQVGFSSGSMEGPFRKGVTVNSTAGSIELHITGSVQSLYTVDPAMITFGKVEVGKTYRRTVVVQLRKGDAPFEFGQVRCLDPQVQIQNEKTLESIRGGSFEVVLTPAAGGWEQGSVSYETGNSEMPRGYVRYSLRREP